MVYHLPLIPKTSVKYLGVIFSSNLQTVVHVRTIFNKTYKTLDFICQNSINFNDTLVIICYIAP